MKKIFSSILLICILFISSFCYAIGFDAEEEYNSVVVVSTKTSVGSGFSIEEGSIITNAHVVRNENKVKIKLYGGEETEGRVVKIDKSLDLALINIDKKIPTIKLILEDMKIGNEVYAIGAPKNMPYTLTKGIISSLNRNINGNEYIQIDASVNEGNSGGPLVNEDGDVIGVVTLKIVDAEGIGLAIKASDVDNFLKSDANETAEEKSDTDLDLIKELEKKNRQLQSKNNTLTIINIILFILVIVGIVLILKTKLISKRKNEYDFEIEIE